MPAAIAFRQDGYAAMGKVTNKVEIDKTQHPLFRPGRPATAGAVLFFIAATVVDGRVAPATPVLFFIAIEVHSKCISKASKKLTLLTLRYIFVYFVCHNYRDWKNNLRSFENNLRSYFSNVRPLSVKFCTFLP